MTRQDTVVGSRGERVPQSPSAQAPDLPRPRHQPISENAFTIAFCRQRADPLDPLPPADDARTNSRQRCLSQATNPANVGGGVIGPADQLPFRAIVTTGFYD
ncbi:hypothetical protein VTJ04DRAFT_6504 [Mycothermus thermophilus]|uniref:uncharacterized protein n=1 Tax=Humicola insolens TaxID=85995 RepID=UPI003743507F